MFYRESLQDSGVNVLMLEDGVGTFNPASPRRAAPYYQGLRNALADREPTVLVWSNVEAFDCEPVDGGPPNCTETHPTTGPRLFDRICSARQRVDGIVTTEYIRDLGGSLLPLDSRRIHRRGRRHRRLHAASSCISRLDGRRRPMPLSSPLRPMCKDLHFPVALGAVQQL